MDISYCGDKTGFPARGAYTESDNAPARNRVWPRETSFPRPGHININFYRLSTASACVASIEYSYCIWKFNS